MESTLRALALIFCLLPATAMAEASKSKIAVLDITGTGIDETLLPTLTEILTVEVHQLDLYEVVSGRDIKAMLGFEEERQVSGCDDASCLAEIGGALGVDRILAGHLGKVGDTFVVNIKLINISKANTEDRVYETVSGKTDALIDVVRKSARRMLGPGSKAAASLTQKSSTSTTSSATGSSASTSTATTAVNATPQPVAAGGGLPLWLPIATAGVGAVSGVVGVFFGLGARSSDAEACEGCVGGQAHAEDAQSSARLANIFYGVGAVALITGGVLFFFTGSDQAPSAALVPMASEEALALTFTGAF